MPSEKSARVAERKRLVNRRVKTLVRTAVAKAREALEGSDANRAEVVKAAVNTVASAARKRAIHPNKAARLKSRLAKRLNAHAKDTPAQ
ncbi:MAG: 30S ribosomal protein S20 [Chloroflexi bacterium]|nr:30S ribosomal protein S20 [Chloroflexota bacterium]